MHFIQAVVDGVLVGGVYAVISIGLTLVFGVIGIINFAQAQFLMLGMFAAYYLWLYTGIDPLLGSLVSFFVVFILGYVLQKVFIDRVLNATPLAQIFLTVGFMIVLENLALIFFGSESHSVRTPYQMSSVAIGPLLLNVPYLAAFLISCIVGLLSWWVLKKTWWGWAVRATSQDPMAAQRVGVPPRKVYHLAFGVGVGLTALGGAIILPYMSVSPTVGHQFGVLMFTVVVLGGLGNVLGAVIGGLAVGMIQSLSSLVFPIQLQNMVLFIVFILILAFRPEGLLKRRAG